MVACYHNITTCEWHHYDSQISYEIDYDIWLVNGSPNSSAFSTYQFSFDRQNTLEMYILFWLCYLVLVPLQCHAVKIQKHPVTRYSSFIQCNFNRYARSHIQFIFIFITHLEWVKKLPSKLNTYYN